MQSCIVVSRNTRLQILTTPTPWHWPAGDVFVRDRVSFQQLPTARLPQPRSCQYLVGSPQPSPACGPRSTPCFALVFSSVGSVTIPCPGLHCTPPVCRSWRYQSPSFIQPPPENSSQCQVTRGKQSRRESNFQGCDLNGYFTNLIFFLLLESVNDLRWI